ncbi:MAG: sensor histidine kinase [Blautia marasmi]
MAHSNEALCGTSLDADTLNLITEEETGTLKEGDINYHTARLDNGWYHVTEIPGSYIRKNTQILLKTIIITLLVSLPLTVLVIIMISGNLTKRLKKLSLAMKTFHLGTSSPSPVPELVPHTKSPSSYDEIDRLGVTFRNMQESLNQNMDSILELSLSEERLKYQLLQSQINPHFLYNILGSVKTCISLGRLETAEQMISDLTQFYRLTLRKSGDLIRIEDELEIARLYLEMEKLCHKDSLTWEIHAEDGIQNFLICRFTLQPFLENSIQHGISRQTPCVHISLDVSYGDDTVIITITDSGAGIAPRQLEELRTTLKTKPLIIRNTSALET